VNQADRIKIEAPEKIEFSYRFAEQGARIGAFVIDIVIQFIAGLITFLLIFAFVNKNVFMSNSFSDDMGLLTVGFFYLIVFFLQWFYFLLWEAFWNGRTPGKRCMKIRVIKENGESLDFQCLLLRNFMRAVDGFPLLHLLGGIVSLIDKKNRRIGDILAGTIVVYEEKQRYSIPKTTVPFNIIELDQKVIHEITAKTSLNEKDLYVIRRYFNEREKIPGNRRGSVIRKLCEEIKNKLKLEENDILTSLMYNDEKFLMTVYSAHAKEDSK